MLIENLELPWYSFICGRGEVAVRLDKLEGFIVERTAIGLTVFLQLEGTTGMELPLSDKEYAVFLKGLTLYQEANP